MRIDDRSHANTHLFITLLVLLCFNLLGEGFEVAGPRILDTLIGCAIAWAAVSFIWPDWRFRGLPAVIDKTINANCRYLDAILEQYHQGKSNSLRYRIARRDAHNSDAELASVVANMSSEPHAIRNTLDDAFRFMCLNHTLLSYISTLGAHREKLVIPQTLQLLDDAICYIDAALHHPDIDVQAQREALLTRQQQVQQLAPDPDSKEQLVLQQIGLIIDVLPELTLLKGTIR